MAYNQQNTFWDFVRSLDQGHGSGEGVDRPAQGQQSEWPFGGAHFGASAYPHPHPPPPPHDGVHPPPPHHGPGHHGHHPPPTPPPPEFGGFPFGGPRGGPFGGHYRGHGRRGRCGGRRGERGGDENGHQGGPFGAFDLNGLLASLASHPLAQQYRHFFEQAAGQQSGETTRDGEVDEDENTFTPPVDIFNTESHFVLHVALPGAKKEDVGINWDTEKGVLNIAGVIYRQGDEEFLKTLTKSERKVGVFERAIKLPPSGETEKDEIDADGITAKLEDGILVVRVPKLEKEWMDVKKVDIE